MNKVYLGDGVYAEYDGVSIILTTENGICTTNRIYLEYEIIDGLNRYVEKIKRYNENKAIA